MSFGGQAFVGSSVRVGEGNEIFGACVCVGMIFPLRNLGHSAAFSVLAEGPERAQSVSV
jgi:hypothetical protein